MGKKSTPAPPATPDYAAAATAQGAANLDAARIGAQLTNTNQITPYGNQIFTKSPDSDQWTSTITLSPEQKRLYDLQTQGQTSLGEAATGMLGRIQDAYGQPIDLSQLPERVGTVGAADYNVYGGPTDAAVKSLDFSSLGNVPGANDFAQQGTDVRDALYRQATSKLDPQFQRQEDQLRTRLLNSGVQEGSEAYKNAMDQYARERTSAYGDARDRAILASGSEQSRLNSDALASRAQMLSQILSGGSFANQAQQQGIDNALRALGVNNQTEAQRLSDAISTGNFANTQRGAALDEAAYLRSLPLNEYNALSTGAQVTNPTFRGTGQVQGPAAAPVFAGAQAQGQNAIDLYNAQMASANSARSGLAGLLGAGLNAAGAAGGFGTLFSDRRLKSDIRQIGRMSGTGLPVYEYVIRGRRAVGVMADEVRSIHPGAVQTDPATGYDMVDYSQVTGTVEAL